VRALAGEALLLDPVFAETRCRVHALLEPEHSEAADCD
jgi:hypothetical protein